MNIKKLREEILKSERHMRILALPRDLETDAVSLPLYSHL